MKLESVSLAKSRPVAAGMVRLDKIASSTANLRLEEEVFLASPGTPRIGDVVAVRTLTDRPTYNQLELTSGRLARVNLHDVIAGVLGPRRALKGFVGEVPKSLQLGDKLHLLNLGGVVGRCTGAHHQLGSPIEVELLGMVARDGGVLNIGQHAMPAVEEFFNATPLILIAGTSMNSGKTHVANELVKHFTRGGSRVAAGKLSGVACLRDTLDMQDHGAVKALSFLDCGYPSTVELEDIAPLARTIVSGLNQAGPDLIVLELGDGILGGYHVDSIFDDGAFMKGCAALVFCAGDFVGAWGGAELLRRRGVSIDVVSGSVTDSQMGVDFIGSRLGLKAANALNGGERLFELVRERVAQWRSSK